MVWKRVIADIWSGFLCHNNLVLNQSLDLVLQRMTFIEGVSLHAGMLCTGFVWVNPLRRVLRG